MFNVALTKPVDTAPSLINAFVGKCENLIGKGYVEGGEKEDFEKLPMPICNPQLNINIQ